MHFNVHSPQICFYTFLEQQQGQNMNQEQDLDLGMNFYTFSLIIYNKMLESLLIAL